MSASDAPKLLFPNYGPPSLQIERGEGCRLWDEQGRRYLDFAGGIATASLGHAHPQLLAALREQAEKVWHIGNFWTSAPTLRLAELLCQQSFAERVFFTNSGSEAMEASVKLARRYQFLRHGSEKPRLAAFTGSFHGRSLLNLALGSSEAHREGFGPLPLRDGEGLLRLPYNDPQALGAMDESLAAVVVEPVQGESGVRAASPAFLQALRERCDQTGALLIFDEVQSGNGRTGWLYAHQRYGVTPDILATAKGLGGGFPIGAVLARDEVAQAMTPGSHGSTFGGNPLACAVAGKALEIIAQPQFLERVRQAAQRLEDGLRTLCGGNSAWQDVRVEGLWAALDCVDVQARNQLLQRLREEQLLVLPAGTASVRLAPPLIVGDEEIDEALGILDRAGR